MIRSCFMCPYSMPHTPIFRSDAFVDKSLAGRYGDVVEELDWSVGEIVKKLEALDLADNTMVVFTSDNGPWLWMQTHGGTAGLFTMAKAQRLKAVCVCQGSFGGRAKIQPGVVSGIGSAMDLFSTVLSLAGVDESSGVDAEDLSPTLLNGEPSPRDSLFYYRGGELRAMRKGRYKISFVSEGAYGMPPRVSNTKPLCCMTY